MAIQIYIVFLWIKWLNVNYLDISINYTSIKINSKLHLIIIIQQKVWLKVKKRLLFVTLNRIVLISSLHYTTYILHCLFVSLFVSLVCTIYHVPYATLSILYYYFLFCFILFFSTCPLYICNSCIFVYVYVYYIYIYIYLICTYLYFCVLLLVLSVCTRE